jgi:hypothetical protein
VNRNPLPTHFSQPGSAQAPPLKVLIRTSDCRFQKPSATLRPY